MKYMNISSEVYRVSVAEWRSAWAMEAEVSNAQERESSLEESLSLSYFKQLRFQTINQWVAWTSKKQFLLLRTTEAWREWSMFYYKVTHVAEKHPGNTKKIRLIASNLLVLVRALMHKLSMRQIASQTWKAWGVARAKRSALESASRHMAEYVTIITWLNRVSVTPRSPSETLSILSDCCTLQFVLSSSPG